MTKLGAKIVGLLKVAPYYLVFLCAASVYSVYSSQYPEYEWWTYYASTAAVLTAVSALGIWYEQKWSILTVLVFVGANIFVQMQLNHSVYFIVVVFAFIVWAQIEMFVLSRDKTHSQVLKEDAENNNSAF